MTLKVEIKDLEKEKFVETGGDVAVRVNDAVNNSLVREEYDYIALSQTATEDIWTYKTGGAGGTTVATITVTYTGATKATISTVIRS